jgi:hypothetical protein
MEQSEKRNIHNKLEIFWMPLHIKRCGKQFGEARQVVMLTTSPSNTGITSCLSVAFVPIYLFCLLYYMVGWLFIVLRSAQEYFTYMETSPLPVKGCKI